MGPVAMPIGAPATARDALRRLEAVRTFAELVQWSHELRRSHLLGADGYSTEVVAYWGRLWPGEVPPQGICRDWRHVWLPSGECVEYVGGWEHGQWRLIAPAKAAA